MDISGISNLATSIADTGTKREVDLAMLKKALDIEASSAAAMVAALPPPTSQPNNLPPHLGQNGAVVIDTVHRRNCRIVPAMVQNQLPAAIFEVLQVHLGGI